MQNANTTTQENLKAQWNSITVKYNTAIRLVTKLNRAKQWEQLKEAIANAEAFDAQRCDLVPFMNL